MIQHQRNLGRVAGGDTWYWDLGEFINGVISVTSATPASGLPVEVAASVAFSVERQLAVSHVGKTVTIGTTVRRTNNVGRS